MSEDAQVTRDFLGEDFIGVQRVVVPGGTSVLDDLDPPLSSRFANGVPNSKRLFALSRNHGPWRRVRLSNYVTS